MVDRDASFAADTQPARIPEALLQCVLVPDRRVRDFPEFITGLFAACAADDFEIPGVRSGQQVSHQDVAPPNRCLSRHAVHVSRRNPPYVTHTVDRFSRKIVRRRIRRQTERADTPLARQLDEPFDSGRIDACSQQEIVEQKNDMLGA